MAGARRESRAAGDPRARREARPAAGGSRLRRRCEGRPRAGQERLRERPPHAAEGASRLAGAVPGGSLWRAASHRARCPPAECPTATTRCEIERVIPGHRSKVVGSPGDVLEGARPPSAGVAQAAVLEAPGRQPLGGERRTEAPDVIEAPGRLPAAPVDHHDDRVGARALGEAQLRHLLGCVAVGHGLVGRGLGQGEQIAGGHGCLGRTRGGQGPEERGDEEGANAGHAHVTLPRRRNSGRSHAPDSMTSRIAATASHASTNRR